MATDILVLKHQAFSNHNTDPIALAVTLYYENNYFQLEQLERLRSEDTPRRLMITHTIESYWIPSQKNNHSRTEKVTERTHRMT